MVKFDLVKKYEGQIDLLPSRSTADSAGYDMVAARDYEIPPYDHYFTLPGDEVLLTLSEIADWTKANGTRPTLVSTGVKVYLEPGQYLKLVSRSSFPLKYLLLCANSEGIIDRDYADNPDNEGEIFFQMINLSPYPIKIKRGEKICQGIICEYKITDDDAATGARIGGFGSTGV